jgi:DNA adenine methylase
LAIVQYSFLSELAPPLKWAGGKRWLLPHLRPLREPYDNRRLVEPFIGGMAIALGLRPTTALLNDANMHLINFYRWLKSGLVIDIRMENDKELYYQHRQRFNQLIIEEKSDTIEAASLFYYLNRTGYNGLCRFNNKGQFNVPFGRYTTINYTVDFTPYVEALRGWELTNGDFSELQLYSNDFVYADPPYDVEFTSYSPGGFNWDDQVRLAHWLSAHPGPVVASNQATKRILDLYTDLGFDVTTLDAPRLIACNGDRTPAREMLATKGL